MKTIENYYVTTGKPPKSDGFLGSCVAIKYKGFEPDEIDMIKTLVLNLSHHAIKEIRHDDEKLVIIDYEGNQHHLDIGDIFIIEENTGDFFVINDMAFKGIFKYSFYDKHWEENV